MDFEHLINEKIISIEEIKKGFTPERKLIVNDKYVVRVISLDRVEHFKKVLKIQKDFESVALCQKAISLKVDEKNGYYVTEYIKGFDGLEVIESYSMEHQYDLGVIAAKEIVKFHKAYPIESFDVKEHLDNYMNNKINKAYEHNVKALLPEIDDIIDVVKNNLHHLYKLKGVQTHADYHLFNMIFDEGEYKGVIDFERVRPGILLTDFRNNTPHNAPVSPYFASGYIDGYLDEAFVEDFFLMYNIYDLLLTIAAIPWVQKFDSENVDKSVELIREIFNQKTLLEETPEWYVGKY